uniref:Uncharacterized protein n=1 Tax=viral metagenome TaxID=1070528 RepID=A0A6C0K0W1_9ZZZZ
MNNIDILWIHNFLSIKYNKGETPERDEDANREYANWKDLYATVKDQQNTSTEVLEDIEGKVRDMEKVRDVEQFSFYLLQAIPLLDEYKNLQKKQQKIYFMSPKSPREDDPEGGGQSSNRDKMAVLLKTYFNLVQTYFPEEYKQNDWDKMRVIIDLPQTEPKSARVKCQVCNSDFSHFIIHDNHFVCETCGCVSTTTHSSVSYKDIDRVNISSKYTYDRRTHFRDTINQFQGKQNASISKIVYEQLIQQFVSHGIVPEDYSSLTRDEAFDKVTKEHILLFLREIKQSKHYEDVVLIHHQMTGKPAPDISYLENVLLSDFDILVETYDKKFKNSERKNFINTQYVLFQLLRRHRYPCKKEDFNMLKTVDRKYFHDTICSELFAEIGWSFTALF